MKLFKTFITSDMDELMFVTIFNCGYFVEDGVTVYRVSSYVSEYENSTEEEKLYYPLDEIEKFRKFDEYLISEGAEKLETVFIYHY